MLYKLTKRNVLSTCKLNFKTHYHTELSRAEISFRDKQAAVGFWQREGDNRN